MLNLNYDITNLKGAEYNPRHIEPEDIDVLCQSLKTLGVVKPIIARGNIIVAGHQRTKALRAMGVTCAPVYLLPVDTTVYDEVRFNQLHNGTDLDCGDEHCFIKGGFDKLGYNFVSFDKLEGNFRCKLASVRTQICKLIVKYGAWGSCVATKSGEVIHAAQYALACKLTRCEITVFVIEDKDKALYQNYLTKTYGVFSYEHLPKDTFIQTYAQLFRLRGKKKENHSTLYENFVLPYIRNRKDLRIIDFGSGQGDYVKRLSALGFNITELEFYRRAKGKNAIDVRRVNAMIDRVFTDITKFGGYDVVVCDSVLNSVDSVEAHDAVCILINALCKKGGRVFFSGRKLDRVYKQDTFSKSLGKNRLVEFLDHHNFSALYRQGRWFYQKFHSIDDVKSICKTYGFSSDKISWNLSDTSWQVEAQKQSNLDFASYKRGLQLEFNLPISESLRYTRGFEAITIFGKVYDAPLEDNK